MNECSILHEVVFFVQIYLSVCIIWFHLVNGGKIRGANRDTQTLEFPKLRKLLTLCPTLLHL